MKKIYTTPVVEINETEAFEMIALSIQEGTADESAVLSREEILNTIWTDDAE